MEASEANRLGGEKTEAPNTKWIFEEHLIVEGKVIEDPLAPLHVGEGRLPDWLFNKKALLPLDTYGDKLCSLESVRQANPDSFSQI